MMRTILFGGLAGVVLIIGHTSAHAGSLATLAPLSGLGEGLRKGEIDNQQLQTLRLQNELLRLKIERERQQLLDEAYARARAQQRLWAQRSLRL